jgi:hypothetical protein
MQNTSENAREIIASLEPSSKKIIHQTQNKTEKNIFNFLMEKEKSNSKMIC